VAGIAAQTAQCIRNSHRASRPSGQQEALGVSFSPLAAMVAQAALLQVPKPEHKHAKNQEARQDDGMVCLHHLWPGF